MDMQHTPIVTVPVSGPIHATAWADPVVHFAQVGHELLHLHLDPNWTRIRSLLCLQTTTLHFRQQMIYSGM